MVLVVVIGFRSKPQHHPSFASVNRLTEPQPFYLQVIFRTAIVDRSLVALELGSIFFLGSLFAVTSSLLSILNHYKQSPFNTDTDFLLFLTGGAVAMPILNKILATNRHYKSTLVF